MWFAKSVFVHKVVLLPVLLVFDVLSVLKPSSRPPVPRLRPEEVSGPWEEVYGRWFMVYGRWFMVYGRWSLGEGSLFVGDGLVTGGPY